MCSENSAADYDSLAIDIAIYEKLFCDFVTKLSAEKTIDPEITGPILKKYGARPGGPHFSALLYAFVAGVNAGIDLALLEAPENPN